MPVENAIVIRELASLDRWRQQLRSTVWPRDLPIVQFQIRQVSSEQNDSLSALAGSLQKACGCKSGGFFMTVTVVAMVVSISPLDAGQDLPIADHWQRRSTCASVTSGEPQLLARRA